MKYGVILLGVLVIVLASYHLAAQFEREPVGKGNSRAMEGQQLLLPYFLTPELIRGEAP